MSSYNWQIEQNMSASGWCRGECTWRWSAHHPRSAAPDQMHVSSTAHLSRLSPHLPLRRAAGARLRARNQFQRCPPRAAPSHLPRSAAGSYGQWYGWRGITAVLDAQKTTAIRFFLDAGRRLAEYRFRIERTFTGQAFAASRAQTFRESIDALGTRHRITRPNLPQTNGKVLRVPEGFVRTLLKG